MKISNFDDDLLELRGFADQLRRFIDIEHDFVDGSLVIALNSKFGFGKSTFLEMWRKQMEKDTDKPLVVSLNAWESDYNDNPLYALVSALAETVERNGNRPDSLLDAVKGIGWFVAGIGSQILKDKIGVDPAAASNFAQNKQMPVDTDAFSVYEKRKKAMFALKEAIQEIVASSSKPKALFLVDELDRCRPDYAISYLETIKHLFDIKGVVFVLATDRQQLENSAKAAFGRDLDFNEYYRKFVHREATLPPISDAGYGKLVESYMDYYFRREDSKLCSISADRILVSEVSSLIRSLKMTPRQIQEAFRILGHLFERSKEDRTILSPWFARGSIIMAVFKVGKLDIYELLGTGQWAPHDAMEFLKKNVIGVDRNLWFLLFLSGGGLLTKEEELHEDILLQVGIRKNINILEESRHGWGQNWVYNPNSLNRIYTKIEQVSQWFKAVT